MKRKRRALKKIIVGERGRAKLAARRERLRKLSKRTPGIEVVFAGIALAASASPQLEAVPSLLDAPCSRRVGGIVEPKPKSNRLSFKLCRSDGAISFRTRKQRETNSPIIAGSLNNAVWRLLVLLKIAGLSSDSLGR
jgi:hypothetical protein